MELIKVITKNGEIRTCCAKCYDAWSPHCTCVCGGLNHGVGFDEAKKNTFTDLVPKILKECPGAEIIINDKVRQEDFFV